MNSEISVENSRLVNIEEHRRRANSKELLKDFMEFQNDMDDIAESNLK